MQPATRYWTLRGATLDRDQSAEWQLHAEAPDGPAVEGSPRVMRGPQDYAGLHLGRGTKWIKPGAKR